MILGPNEPPKFPDPTPIEPEAPQEYPGEDPVEVPNWDPSEAPSFDEPFEPPPLIEI